MNEQLLNQPIATVPNSLQAQLDRAQTLLTQSSQAESRGDNTIAIIKAREGLRVLQALARHNSEMAAMLIAVEQGHKGFEIEVYERIDRHQVIERKFLGMTIATDVVNLPTITRSVRKVRVI